MGNVWSGSTGENRVVTPEDSRSAEISTEKVLESKDDEKFGADEMEDFYERRKREREIEMDRFRKELAEKRRARQEALGSLGREMRALREERIKREEAEKELEEVKGKAGDLDELRERAHKTDELEKQVKALKDVANIGKQILAIREKQVNELNNKLKVLEETGAEYEREVQSVKRLRVLYDERERARETEHKVELEREKARTSVVETRLALARQEAREASTSSRELTERNQELTEKVERLDSSLEEARAEISELRVEMATRKEEAYKARSQMELVNGLFTGVLTGRSNEVDRLAKLIEENRPLIADLTAKGRIDQVASVLMDVATPQNQEEVEEQQPSEDVSHNLTKVWTVMIELLSHHKSQGGDGVPESCYKSVETPKGPRLVISPSQTFIRLKDLILEKNCLVKEVGRLKVLNGHLETRLDEQEKRLSLVTSELHKTWGVVNKLRSQHQQLHTQEKILRFELQHKRHLLTELKKELEICREQWEAARIKNSQTEEDWKLLREEFASRKRQGGAESTESGFEDEGDSLGSEEPEEEEAAPPVNLEESLQQAEEDVLKEIIQGQRVVPDNNTEEIMERLSEGENELKKEEPSVIPEGCDFERGLNKVSHLEMVPEAVEEEETRVSDPVRLTQDEGPTEKVTVLPENSEAGTTQEPSTSSEAPKRQRTTEEMLQAREERLKRLEDQCKSLFTKMSNTSVRSDVISNKLEELHQQYGEGDSGGRSPPNNTRRESLQEEQPSPTEPETNPNSS